MASKAERWAARARAVHAGSAPDPSARGAAAEDPPAGDCGQEPAGVQAATARHDQGHLEWTLPQQAARGSAMEAWLARAEAKQLHLPWPGKIRDYADEVKCVKAGLTQEEIVSRRRHLNPPETQRIYSSIRFTADIPSISGLGWARSCLDSRAAWCPSTDELGQWMEIDLLEDMELLGIVTQGQAATCCGGEVGVCAKLCEPPHPCTGGGEVNFVSHVQVQHRQHGEIHFQTVPEALQIAGSDEKSCEKRLETLFKLPIRARYVRMTVIKSVNRIALRAGVVVEVRDQLFERSPFALNGMCHGIHLDSINGASGHNAAMDTTAVRDASPTVSTSKASRWAARAAGKTSVEAPAATGEPAQLQGQPETAGGKAARLAASVGRSGMTEEQSQHVSVPQPSQPPESVPSPSSGTGDGGIQDGAGTVKIAREASQQQLTYTSFSTPELSYSGWVLDGQPHQVGRLKMADGTEYHGQMHKGHLHGGGDYYFPDQSKLSIRFLNGCPKGKGQLVDAGGQHWDVEYDGALPLHEGAAPSSKVEGYPEQLEEATIDFLAVVVKSSTMHRCPIVPPQNRVIGKLVMARPLFGDMPLWNKEECRNAIVVMARGPASSDYKVSFSLKIHHAQMAGARAVVIVDGMSRSFDTEMPPEVQEGPVEWGIKPKPPDLEINIRIPAVMILAERAHLLREKAIHVLHYLDPENCAGLPVGVRVGYVHIPKQESKVGMEKTKAQTMMADFFAERRKERSEEVNMLIDVKRSGKDQADETLKSREFYGGNFFESMNPFKEVKGAENLNRTVKEGMMRKMNQMPGVGKLKEKLTERVQKLRQDVQVALPVTLAWHESDEDDETDVPEEDEKNMSPYSVASFKKATGLQMPTILPKDPAGNFVWCAVGQPPFGLRIRASKTTTPVRILFEGWEMSYDKKLAIRMSSVFDSKVVSGNGSQISELVGGMENCEQFNNTKITVLISVNAEGYHVTMRNVTFLKDQIWFLPHNVPLASVSMDKLSTLPLEKFGPMKLKPQPGEAERAPPKPPKVWRLSPTEGVFRPPLKPRLQWNLEEDWRLVFRHTAVGTDANNIEFSEDNDWAQAKYLNEDDPSAANFSILGKLEDFRCSDGKFTMLLRWPDIAPTNANIWRQSSNPVTMDEEGVDDFVPVQVDFEGANFCGLQKTDHFIRPHASCFINGCDHHGDWFYAIGTSKLWNKQIPGPNKQGAGSVELYVTTKDVGIDVEPQTVLEGKTDPDDSLCEHGRLKGSGCDACKDALSGHYVIDHNPYIPCTSGHGPRWLWDLSERGPQRKTLRSKRFFDDLHASKQRAVAASKYPVPYNLDFEQTSCTGYHNLQLGDRVRFSGWLSNGLPEGMCSVRWSDGSEFHGEFLDGEMTGYGRYIFADTSEYRGDFKNALALNGMYYPPQQGETRRMVDDSFFCGKPLWNVEQPILKRWQHLPESPLPPFSTSKAIALALIRKPELGTVEAKDRDPEDQFGHMTAVTARLMWARPIYADQPLWNAADCRGKIVACLRGPRWPAPPCNLSSKLFHCQNAGAVGVIFVDFECFSKFTSVHCVEDGPIYPEGPILKVQIPCMLTLNSYAGVLQEGAPHTMTLADNATLNMPAGWNVGFILCLQQESERLTPRAAEGKLLEEHFKEQHEKYDPPVVSSASIAHSMLTKVTNEKKAKELADRAGAAAKKLNGFVQGALGASIGLSAAAEVPETARPQTPGQHLPQDFGEVGRKADPNEGSDCRDKVAEEKRKRAARLRTERLELLSRLEQLELENKRLREQQEDHDKSESGSVSSPSASASSSSFFISPSKSTTSHLAAWTPTSAKEPTSPHADDDHGPSMPASKPKPEWL